MGMFVLMLSDTDLTEVLFVSGKQTQWLDYLPSPLLALCTTSVFCAVAMLDGTVGVYSHTGRK
jgi:protein HIRA/HIR1